MMCDAVRRRLFEEIALATGERLDQLLDLYLDYRDRATEWDAEKWGFNPERWMLDERRRMEYRIAHERKLTQA